MIERQKLEKQIDLCGFIEKYFKFLLGLKFASVRVPIPFKYPHFGFHNMLQNKEHSIHFKFYYYTKLPCCIVKFIFCLHSIRFNIHFGHLTDIFSLRNVSVSTSRQDEFRKESMKCNWKLEWYGDVDTKPQKFIFISYPDTQYFAIFVCNHNLCIHLTDSPIQT